MCAFSSPDLQSHIRVHVSLESSHHRQHRRSVQFGRRLDHGQALRGPKVHVTPRRLLERRSTACEHPLGQLVRAHLSGTGRREELSLSGRCGQPGQQATRSQNRARKHGRHGPQNNRARQAARSDERDTGHGQGAPLLARQEIRSLGDVRLLWSQEARDCQRLHALASLALAGHFRE